MRKSLSLKAVLLMLMVIWVAVARMLSRCSLAKDDGGRVWNSDFTVVDETDVPEEFRSIIAEKKARPFRLTCSDSENLYIMVGYGPQDIGGYSIIVKELYLMDNFVVIDTELIGPVKGENPAAETSYPYVVVKTEYLENPVVLQ